jgi:GxxExxY protein
MTENEISTQVLDSAIEVHRTLGGPGLLEKVYEEALVCELGLRGLSVQRQAMVPITYKGHVLATPLRMDVLVERKVVVECKATDRDNDLFKAQTLTYLRLSGLKLGILINFGTIRVKDGYHRIVNGL